MLDHLTCNKIIPELVLINGFIKGRHNYNLLCLHVKWSNFQNTAY